MRGYVREAESFRRDGLAIVRGVLTNADLQPVIDEISTFIGRRAAELASRGVISDTGAGLDFSHRVVRLYAQSRDILDGIDIMQMRGRAMFDFLHNERLLDMVEAFLGPEITCNPIQHLRAKMPFALDGESSFMNVPWHQDVGVTHPDSEPSAIITFWTPLVDATLVTGCMELMPECASLGALPHVKGAYGTEIAPASLPARTAVTGECRKGDVVVMSKYTPHRGTPNRSDFARWSIDLRYQVTGHHSGRLVHPDFPVRSRRDPASVKRDYAGWCQAWERALADTTPVSFHRVSG